MSDLSDLIVDLIVAGVDAALVGRVAAVCAAREVVVAPDEQAQRRREKDRERARVRRNPQKSAESADTDPSPSSETKGFPTPLPKTQPSSLTPTPPIVPPSRKSGFDRFWEAWEPKVSKGQAERTFAKVIKTVDLETILAGVHRARAFDSRWADGCPQHASTWLNAKGWLDEPKAGMRRAPNWRELETENNDASYRGAAMAIEIMQEKDRLNGRSGQDGIIDGSCATLPKVEPNGSGAGALVVRLSERLAGTLSRSG